MAWVSTLVAHARVLLLRRGSLRRCAALQLLPRAGGLPHAARLCSTSARTPARAESLAPSIGRAVATAHVAGTASPVRLAVRNFMETVRFVLVLMAALSALRAYENLDGEVIPRAWIRARLASVSDALTLAIGSEEQKAAVKARQRQQKREQHAATRGAAGAGQGGKDGAAAPSAPVKRYMTVDGKRICYYDDGVGTPVIVINSTTKLLGLPLHKELSKITRCITYDHVGLGESVVPNVGAMQPADRSVEAMSTELAAVLRGARVESDVVLVSTYMNWMSTLLCARKNAGGVAGVVLAEPLVPDRRDTTDMSDDEFMRRCLAGTTWWAKSFLLVENLYVWLATMAFGDHPHMLNPGARTHRDLSAVDALAEKTFVASLYREDPDRRFSLESCVPNPDVLATALLVRWRSDPRWHTLMYEAIGLETAYGEEVSRGRLVAPPFMLKGGAYVPDSVPVSVVACDFDHVGVGKAAAANTNLFDYFSRPWDLHLPGVQLRLVLPPSIRELNIRMRMCRYRLLRDFSVLQFVPHAKLVTFTPTTSSAAASSGAGLDVTDVDVKSVAAEVRAMVIASRSAT